MNVDDEYLEGQIENAAAIAECALEDAYQNRDCSEIDAELERAFCEYREAAETIKQRVGAFAIRDELRASRHTNP